MVNPRSIFFFENFTLEVKTAFFDLKLVILEVILYQLSTHTVMGTDIGVNPHSKNGLAMWIAFWTNENEKSKTWKIQEIDFRLKLK